MGWISLPRENWNKKSLKNEKKKTGKQNPRQIAKPTANKQQQQHNTHTHTHRKKKKKREKTKNKQTKKTKETDKQTKEF